MTSHGVQDNDNRVSGAKRSPHFRLSIRVLLHMRLHMRLHNFHLIVRCRRTGRSSTTHHAVSGAHAALFILEKI